MNNKLDAFKEKMYEMLEWAVGNGHIDQITADEVFKPMVDDAYEELKN